MASMIVIAVYVVIGAGAAAAMFARDRKLLRPIAMLVLWPFLLPAALFGEPLPAPRGRAQKIEALREEIAAAFARTLGSSERELRIVEAFVGRVLAEERSVAELEATIATAHANVRARLEQLRERAYRRLETAIGMLEEMAAQLTLLRFSELEAKSGDEERRKIEDLMARIEALAALSTE